MFSHPSHLLQWQYFGTFNNVIIFSCFYFYSTVNVGHFTSCISTERCKSPFPAQSPKWKMLAVNVMQTTDMFRSAHVIGYISMWHLHEMCHIMITLHDHFLSIIYGGGMESGGGARQASDCCLLLCFNICKCETTYLMRGHSVLTKTCIS